MFKNYVGIKETFLESVRSIKIPLKARFQQTSYKDFVTTQSDIRRLVGYPNESFRLIIMYYMFKDSVGIKRTLLESIRSIKSH